MVEIIRPKDLLREDLSSESLREAYDLILDTRLSRVLLVGPRGSGAVQLARRLWANLWEPSETMLLEANTIHQSAGLLGYPNASLKWAPFRAPHYTASRQAFHGMLGRPGEVSLAHSGVLILEELGEFPALAIETIQEILERGAVTISGSRRTGNKPITFAAKPQLFIGIHYMEPDGAFDKRAFLFADKLGLTPVTIER